MEENRLKKSIEIMLIGGSAGSLQVLFTLIPELDVALPFALIIVLHRGNFADSALSELISGRTNLPVRDVEDKDQLLPSNIYLAPADYHLLIEKDRTCSLDYSEKVNFSRPSIDVTFESAADVYGAKTAALLLSGANDDGTRGLKTIRRAGGLTMAQNPETAQMPFMPGNAIHHGAVDHILNAEQMGAFINALK